MIELCGFLYQQIELKVVSFSRIKYIILFPAEMNCLEVLRRNYLHRPAREERPIMRFVSNKSSKKEVSSVTNLPNGSEQETLGKHSCWASSISGRKNRKPTTQVMNNHPGPHNMCNFTIIATLMKVNRWA